MEIKMWQSQVDQWIKDYGVRYFDVKTNALLLNEEIGELSRLIAREHGEQSFKKPTSTDQAHAMIEDELGDVLFVLTCIANQLDIDLEDVIARNIEKKTARDHQRHHDNEKLK